MKRLWIFFIILTVFNVACNPYTSFASKKEDSKYMMVIQTSEHTIYRTAESLHPVIQKAIEKANWTNSPYPPVASDFFIEVGDGDIKSKLIVSEQGYIIDSKGKKIMKQLPFEAREMLWEQYKNLQKQHYGEDISWNLANQLLPKYSSFTVLDLDTGNSFQVQRRAGSNHADVQPLTINDTKKMKEIYKGTWSWDRRAIIAVTEKGRYAASMHGMPHGAGALQNGFPGHFCIHFNESVTHKTKKMDYAHSIMVKKASGKWLGYTKSLTPMEMVDAFIISVNQHDFFILHSLFGKADREILKQKEKVVESILHLKRLSNEVQMDTDNKLEANVPVKVHIHKRSGANSKEITFRFNRETIFDQWNLDLEHTLKQIID
ncbi:hypothetical protein [Bacillus sp. FJAT-45066]|uniref:hypothetical protein n=1 Tax=Bacillus sp. FJAT-45066 TaxID=2011010 RepID=UPI000BB83594|nr:hypothetical protein [Bacillus sp. FJAT-45066]